MTKTLKNAPLWERDPDDWYVEPAWCSDALFAVEPFEGVVCDPCCGMGRILDAAARAGHATFGSDIVDRGASKRHSFGVVSFVDWPMAVDNIVCNPPYKFGDDFVQRVVDGALRKSAVLLRAQWANAGTRSRWLESLPLRRVLMLTPRPSMPPGAVILHDGKDPSGGRQDYAWFVFERDFVGSPSFGWARRPKKAS